MKRLKKIMAIFSLAILTATCFMPIAIATDSEEATNVKFDSKIYIDGEYLVLDISLSELGKGIASISVNMLFDDTILDYDHCQDSETLPEDSTFEHDCEDNKISFTQDYPEPLTDSGSIIKVYFVFDREIISGKQVEFKFEEVELKDDSQEDIEVDYEDNSFKFEAYGEKEVYSSEAYIDGEFLVVEISLDQLSFVNYAKIQESLITLRHDEDLTFDHYEELNAFIGTATHEVLENAVKVTQKRDEQNITGEFMKFFFKSDAALSGTFVFELEIVLTAPGFMTWPTVTGCEVTVYLLGDVNGDGVTNTGDAVCILRHITEDELLDEAQLSRADINEDGKVNTGDAVKILTLVLADDVDEEIDA